MFFDKFCVGTATILLLLNIVDLDCLEVCTDSVIHSDGMSYIMRQLSVVKYCNHL